MQILDSKTTFLDDDGKPLSGGRLRYFAFGTTTPVFVFADSDYVTNLGTTVALTSAGWTSTSIYCQQSVTVHVDRFLGLDEFGAELYEEIKVYDYITGASSGGGSDSAIVDTIDDLRDVTPINGLAVTVKGYFTASDCFPRTYIWNDTSTALENGGTTIESSINPLGRWLLGIDGPYVDCRIFGMLVGTNPVTSNSVFAQLVSYCQINKKTAYFGTGSYYLTSGGSLTASCAIKADKDVQILSTNGTYNLTIDGNMQDVDIYNTFASTGVTLIVKNTKSLIPDTAWGRTLTTLPLNFGLNIGLKLTKTQTIELNNTHFYDIQLAGGTSTITGSGTSTRILKNDIDTGLLKFVPNISGDVCIDAPEIRSSMIDMTTTAESIAHILYAFTGVFVVDVPVVGAAYDDYVSFTVAKPVMDIRASFDTSAIWDLPNIININAGVLAQTFRFHRPIDINWFTTASRAVSSYAYSYDVAYLDMQGKVTTSTVEKYDSSLNIMPIDIRNGTVKYVNSSGNTSVKLYNMVVNRTDTNTSYVCVNSANLYAENCTFVRYPGGKLFADSIRAILHDCTFAKTDNSSSLEILCEYPASLEMHNCKEAHVSTQTAFKLSGHAVIDKSVFGGATWIVPKSQYVEDISIQNSTLGQLTFTAASGNQTAAMCKNVVVMNNVMTSSASTNTAINISNGSTYKWAINGHKNLKIENNWNESYGIPCRSTSDRMRVKYTHYNAGQTGYRNYYMDVAKYLFVLNTNDSDIAEGLTGSGLYASYITVQFLGVNYVGTSQGMIFASYFNQWSNSRIYTNNQFWVRCMDHDIVSTDAWYVSWKLYK